VKPGRLIASWIARTAFALVLIVLILIVARHLAGPAGDWIGAQSRTLRTVPAQQAAYAEASEGFQAYAARRRVEARVEAAALARSGEGQLRAREQAIGPEIARQSAARISAGELAVAAARGDSSAVLDHYRAEAEIALLERERLAIQTLLSARTERLQLDEQRRAAVLQLRASHAEFLDARARAERLERRFMAEARNSFCQVSPLEVGCNNYRALVAARAEMRSSLARNRQARVQIAAIDQARGGLAVAGAAVESADTVLDRQRAVLGGEAARLKEAASGSVLITAWRAVSEVLPTALTILVMAMVSPILVKAALYFWVAPLAARRPPIRLLESDRGEVAMTSGPAVSQRVALAPGEELLAPPQAVQSTPHHADKRTRWLLSWAMPLSSLASGLAALTAITVSRPDTVLLSATGGPLNEIALVRLARGSALGASAARPSRAGAERSGTGPDHPSLAARPVGLADAAVPVPHLPRPLHPDRGGRPRRASGARGRRARREPGGDDRLQRGAGLRRRPLRDLRGLPSGQAGAVQRQLPERRRLPPARGDADGSAKGRALARRPSRTGRCGAEGGRVVGRTGGRLRRTLAVTR
jgi:hypothetical protein